MAINDQKITLSFRKSNFDVTVRKQDGKLQVTDPITVKNQIQELGSIDDIPGVNTSLKVDGSTLIYNANTGQYDVKLFDIDPYLEIGNLHVTHLYANNELGQPGQTLLTNGNTVYWSDAVLSIVPGAGIDGGGTGNAVSIGINTSYISTLTSNNATYAYGKTEGTLNVNSAFFAANASFAYYAADSGLFAGQSPAYYANATNLTSGTLNELRLPTTGVSTGTFGNSSSIPVITVDQYGRINAISVSAVAGVTAYGYDSSNNTFSIATGDGSTFFASITEVNSLLVSTGINFVGGSINATSYSGTSNNAVHAFGKTENVLNVNSAVYATNSAFAFTSNNAVHAFGKIEGSLNVNSSVFSTNSSFSYVSNNATLLGGNDAAYYTNATNISAGTIANAFLPIIDGGEF